MKAKEAQEGFQPFRELEWLADFFAMHSTEKIAQTIFRQITEVRKTAQKGLDENTSNVIPLFKNRKLDGPASEELILSDSEGDSMA